MTYILSDPTQRWGRRQRQRLVPFVRLALWGLAVVLPPTLAEVRSVSKVYHSACLERGQRYWDYENFQLASLEWEDVERFEVTRRLGCGRFSEVVEAVTTDNQRRVVLKVLKPVGARKIKREIRVLQASSLHHLNLLDGGTNIIKLEGVCRDPTTGSTTLVLEHLGDEAQWLGHTQVPMVKQGGNVRGGHGQELRQRGGIEEPGYGQGVGGNRGGKAERRLLTDLEIRHYLYKLLQALDYAHLRGIMHRDIKPRNVIINRRTGCLRVIDWGLGDFYIPGEAIRPVS
ncbi:unnamed protein product [Choristocarpus tenellus]